MNLEEFVNKVFLRYPPDIRGDDTEEKLMADYINALDSAKEYNFEAAFKELMISYSFKTLPTAKILYEILNRNVVKRGNNNNKGKYPIFTTLFAFHPKDNCWFEYGIEPSVGEYATKQYLIKKGFTQITNKNPKWGC